MGEPGVCPVCEAGFRATRLCSRCGADLTTLMMLAVESWRLRRRGRLAFLAGDLGSALELASAAQRLQATESGRRLESLARWLKVGDRSLDCDQN